MAVTYEWVIEGLDAYPKMDNRVNQVHTVHWRLNGVDGYSATAYGTVGVQYDSTTKFVDFTKLSKDEVVSWVIDALGEEEVTRLKAGIAGEINARKTPTSVSLDLPWNN